MSVTDSDRRIIENMFKAMQAGPDGEEAMMSLFHEHAVFTEPFSGAPQTHEGVAAIRQSFREMWANPAPDLALHVDRIDLEGDSIRADWTCTSPVFPSPMRGYDLFRIRDGKIARLDVIVTDMPPMGP